jgi:hypothetical protein
VQRRPPCCAWGRRTRTASGAREKGATGPKARGRTTAGGDA